MDRSSSAILLEHFLIFDPWNTYWSQGCCESSPCPHCRGPQRCAPTQERFSDRQPRRHHGYQRWSSQTWWMCRSCVFSGWKGRILWRDEMYVVWEKVQSISRPFCSSSSTMNQCHGRTSSPQPDFIEYVIIKERPCSSQQNASDRNTYVISKKKKILALP